MGIDPILSGDEKLSLTPDEVFHITRRTGFLIDEGLAVEIDADFPP
jgi:hypothetical protein